MLNEKFDLGRELKPYLIKFMTLELKPGNLAKHAKEAFMDSVNILEELPEAAKGFLKLEQQNEIGISLDTQEFHAIKKEIDRQSDIRLLNLLLVAILIGTAVLFHLEGIQTIVGMRVSTVGLLAAGILAIMLLVRIRSRT